MKDSALFATYFFAAGFLPVICAENASEKTEDFKLRQNDGGFTLTPMEFTGNDDEDRFSLHFGKAMPKPEQ